MFKGNLKNYMERNSLALEVSQFHTVTWSINSYPWIIASLAGRNYKRDFAYVIAREASVSFRPR